MTINNLEYNLQNYKYKRCMQIESFTRVIVIDFPSELFSAFNIFRKIFLKMYKKPSLNYVKIIKYFQLEWK